MWGGDSPPPRHISKTKRPILMGQMPFDCSQLELSDSSKKSFKSKTIGSQRAIFSKSSRFHLTIRIAITSVFLIRFRRNFRISFFIHWSFKYCGFY